MRHICAKYISYNTHPRSVVQCAISVLNSQPPSLFYASIPTFKKQSYKNKKKLNEKFRDHCLDPSTLLRGKKPLFISLYT
jgi:hypothetical protein